MATLAPAKTQTAPRPSPYVIEKARAYEAAGHRATWIGIEWIEGELAFLYRMPAESIPGHFYKVSVVSFKQGEFMLICGCRAGQRDSRAPWCKHRLCLQRQLGEFSLDEVVA